MAGDTDRTMVSILRANYGDLDIEGLLRPLGGMVRFVSPGDRVLLKVNLLSASEPRNAVTTHPAVVSAVAQAVLDAGGKPFIGDSPAGRLSTSTLRRAYERSGFARVARDLGIDLNWDTGNRTVCVDDGRRLRSIRICDFVWEADRIIALPKLKTHSFQVMTLATKIMYGAVPGLEKARLHAVHPGRAGFADMLLDVLATVPPDLFVLDGIVGMEGEGPGSGTPVEIGVVMASTNAVAMDLSVCRMLGIEPVGVPTLRRARVRGLGTDRVQYPLLRPEDVRHEGFRLPVGAGRLARGGRVARRVPVVNDRCTACGRCEEICPRGAIVVCGGRAVVDLGRCISCHCCHEVCPAAAITLRSRPRRKGR